MIIAFLFFNNLFFLVLELKPSSNFLSRLSKDFSFKYLSIFKILYELLNKYVK